jgi:DNA-binding CsgD family transcriptional regulator
MSTGNVVEEPRARAVLASLMQLEREIVELRFTQRLDATERVREALRRMADAGAAPPEILELAAAELGECTAFDRVLVSRLRGTLLRPVAMWRADPAPSAPIARADELRAAAVPIDAASVEARVASSGRTVLVDPGRDGRPPVALPVAALGADPFVLGAVTLRGEAIALVHAALDPTLRAPAELDRELVELFAAGLSSVLERAALEQALARHRTRLASAARFLERRIGVTAAPVAPPPAAAAAPEVAGDPLTARELEVLSLVARGYTNRAAAGVLGISEGTVKYHVKNVLRKLRARSRADAVARHLRTTSPTEPSR